MRKIIVLIIVCLFAKYSNAQCDKHVVYTSAKEEFTNAKDEIQKVEEDKITVKVSDTAVVLTHNDDSNDAMKGTIKDMQCNWAEAFKNGKTILTATVDGGNGDVHTALIIIEGKDGKIVITLAFNNNPDMKIKAYVDTYEEVAR